MFFFSRFFFSERTRPAASIRLPCLIYLYTSTGVRTGCHYLIISLCLCLCVCVTLVFLTDFESCTRPISTNPRSMEEECEYGLPRGTCFTARRLEVVAVVGLLWIYFVVCFFSVW